jgi:FixJ family two-component response regulator
MASVLIIDDEEIIRQRLKNLLSLDGFTVHTAGSGPEGISLFEQASPDVVVADIKMPGISGIDVLKKIKGEGSTAEVILLTGHGGLDTAIAAIKEGAFGYVEKPMEYEMLLEEINRALDHQHSTNERLRMEQELRLKTALSQALLDALPCVAFVLRRSSYEIVITNKSGAQMGLHPGMRCYERWMHRTTSCPWCLAPEIWDHHTQQHREFESEGVLWDAHWVPIDEEYFLHYAFDITNKRRMEEELGELRKICGKGDEGRGDERMRG